jgi:hypothetical protein
MWNGTAKVFAHARLYEGSDCTTSDLDGIGAESITYISPSRNAQIPLYVHNDAEGGDYATVNLSLTNYATVI